MQKFNDFNISKPIQEALDKLNFETPTPIQSAAIPLALEGKDILGSAQTGTGKTIAFSLPLVNKLYEDTEGTALVITPTRELALQVINSIKEIMGYQPPFKTALLIGGEHIQKQLQKLKRSPRLIVGTPGRINDHLRRKTLKIDKISFLVLDETDRMLDMGFSDQIADIYNHIGKKPQTLLFSATLPKEIMRLAESYLKNYERVAIGSTSNPAKKIEQEFVLTPIKDKFDILLKKLDGAFSSTVIFVNTKQLADSLALRLEEEEYKVEAIHGDLRHRNRERVVQRFRENKFQILIATDILSRGIDIPHIELVVNYDLPLSPEDYVHRIGRTARASAEGKALSFVSQRDKKYWEPIERNIKDSKNVTITGESPETFFEKTKRSSGRRKPYQSRNSQNRRNDNNSYRPNQSDRFKPRSYSKSDTSGKSTNPFHKRKDSDRNSTRTDQRRSPETSNSRSTSQRFKKKKY